MKLDYTKNLDELTEKELMKFIIGTQTLILRRLDDIESKIKGSDEQTHQQTVDEIIFKASSNIDRINETLERKSTD
ncbi:hypothetical protein SAMN05444285_1613 [Draconibacterium orientale]|uniref:Uncharacterized protein n=1 Tax=Draconibacterium orientale TaxID=1168034 RepID=X5E4J7_9BACT|nr:hypothetical protein [Draconibacterium orientale]AHW61546.1 hypothetical protein FH5T_03630 [Draconibacterium orientale]SEU15581.1 hypothetical protein SAMN05444285_1613 [Draconibacterium orientale]